MIGIYKITNLITKQIYIGQTRDFKRRVAEYKCPKRSHNPKLNDDFAKYGIENFSFDLIEECEEKDLKERELFYIRKLQPYYNEIGKPRSESTKKKLSQSTKQQWQRMTDEQKAKILTQNLIGPKKGHIVTDETREKLRRANLGKRRFKPVMIVETGEIFPGTKECAQRLGVTQGAICYNLRGKTELTKGYHIKYV